MKFNSLKSGKVISLLIFILLFLFIFANKNFSIIIKDLNYKAIEIKNYDIENFLFDYKVRNEAVLIFEFAKYHFECTPSYAKYFIDLGLNVDIIMNKIGLDTFCLWDNFGKLQIFFFNDYAWIKQFYSYISEKIKKYNYILIETVEPRYLYLYKDLGLLESNKTIFVMHHIDFIKKMNFSKYNLENRIWSLGNFPSSLRVSPHYFGKFNLYNKNKVTTFFITSTIHRTYKFLISAAEQLAKENLNFKINVVGKFHVFSEKNISQQIKKYFQFRYGISYFELYKEVLSSDFIIINLDPKNKKSVDFSKIRVTGSISLVYGFYKPALIDIEFANLYNLTINNSLIYDNINYNFFEIMRKAIILNNKSYKKLQSNLIELSNKLFQSSLKNVQKSINKV